VELRTEEEQIAAIKDWWKRNGSSLLIGIGAALAIVFGWQAWENHQEEQQSAAGAKFQQLITAVSQPDGEEKEKTITFVTKELQDEFDSSAYAVYGSLILAAHQFSQQDDAKAAVETLKWAKSHAAKGPLVTLITQRQAQAEFAAGDADAALSTLRSVDEPGEYAALYAELEGDILRSQGDIEGAREAYTVARDAAGDARNPILELKMADMAIGEDA
tara:strand:- start:202 stop:852 length:651 start_codon:yes stop_codon:yes gene_type:complete